MSTTALCPERNWHRHPREVQPIGDDRYRCSCGCVFRWLDLFTWEVLVPGADGPLAANEEQPVESR